MQARAGFTEWLASEPGRLLAQYERARVRRLLADLFGYYVAQLGAYEGEALHTGSHIANRIVLRFAEDGSEANDCGVLAQAAALPFAADSVDVVIIPHVLEFSGQPKVVLEEVERILIPEGSLIIAGFNPWSLWGLWRLLPLARTSLPRNGHFHDAMTLRRWLSAQGFELLALERFMFRPPLRREDAMQKLLFLEKMGKYCCPFFASAYVMLARKRHIPLTPRKVSWPKRRKLMPSGASADAGCS